MNIWTLLIAVLSGATLSLLSVLLGAWISHKGSKPGEPFISTGKGEVFRVPFPEDVPDFPDEDTKEKEKLVKRTADFLKNIGGK